MTILADTLVGCAVLLKIVIDRSMTIFACIRNGLSQKIVIDWSMTIFCAYPFPIQAKIVIDRSMTVLAETMVHPAALQTVIDRSMTVFGWIFKNCH